MLIKLNNCFFYIYHVVLCVFLKIYLHVTHTHIHSPHTAHTHCTLSSPHPSMEQMVEDTPPARTSCVL